MFARDMDVRSFDRTLEVRPMTLNRIGVVDAAHILASRMIDRGMLEA
jgi:hypothetical protein